MAEAEIISLAHEPKLRYYFVTTETKLDGYLLDHWSNVIEDMPDEGDFLSQKNHLRDLIDLQSVHDIVVFPFNRFPPLGEHFLPMLEDLTMVTYNEVAKGIKIEKANRLKNIIDTFYREKLERENIVGVFIPDMDDQFKNIFIPNSYSNAMEVQVAINQSIEKVMGDIFKNISRKKIRKEKPGELLVGNITVGTEIDKLLLENWLKMVQDSMDLDPTVKTSLIVVLNLQLLHRVAVAPFNTLPNVGQSVDLSKLNMKELTNEVFLTRIDKEKHDRLLILGQKFFKNLITKTRRKAGIMVTDFDPRIKHQVILEGLKERDRERLLFEIESRNDMIARTLQELKESEAIRKANQFKEEALGVLQTHIDRQKYTIIPELDIFTGTPIPKSVLSRPVPNINVASESEGPDLIDLASPKRSPEKIPQTPERIKIYGDLLSLEGHKTPILTPKPVNTRRRLENDFSMSEARPTNLLDTTPPILIMARPPLEPERHEWWDKGTHINDILEPMQPNTSEVEKPFKSFMETASDWIKYANVHLNQRETKAGYNLWSDILSAPTGSEPISEPMMPEGWEAEDRREDDVNIIDI